MKPPRRMLDDPSLSAELRNDLARAALSSHPFDVAKGLSDLQRSLRSAESVDGVSADSAAPHGEGFAPVQPAGLGSIKAIPWVIKVGLAAFVGVGVVSLAVPETRPTQRPARPAAVQEFAPSAPASSAAARTAQVEAGGSAREQDVEPASQLAGSSANERSSYEAPAESPSRREIAQLFRVKQLLAREPALAYRLLQASQREFPRGALREEREGLSVLARWRLGPEREARAQTADYLARYPQSPLRKRLERLLAGEAEP